MQNLQLEQRGNNKDGDCVWKLQFVKYKKCKRLRIIPEAWILAPSSTILIRTRKPRDKAGWFSHGLARIFEHAAA